MNELIHLLVIVVCLEFQQILIRLENQILCKIHQKQLQHNDLHYYLQVFYELYFELNQATIKRGDFFKVKKYLNILPQRYDKVPSLHTTSIFLNALCANANIVPVLKIFSISLFHMQQ